MPCARPRVVCGLSDECMVPLHSPKGHLPWVGTRPRRVRQVMRENHRRVVSPGRRSSRAPTAGDAVGTPHRRSCMDVGHVALSGGIRTCWGHPTGAVVGAHGMRTALSRLSYRLDRELLHLFSQGTSAHGQHRRRNREEALAAIRSWCQVKPVISPSLARPATTHVRAFVTGATDGRALPVVIRPRVYGTESGGHGIPQGGEN